MNFWDRLKNSWNAANSMNSKPPKTTYDHVKNFAQLAELLKESKPNSREREQLLAHGNIKGMLDITRFGANVSIVSPVPHTLDPDKILDNTYFAMLSRAFKGKDGQSKPDGIGAFGGRGDKGETPITAAMREMVEEQLDAGLVRVPENMKAADFIKQKIDAFVEEYKDTGIMGTGNDGTKITQAIEALKARNAVFKAAEGLEIDFKRFSYVRFDEAVDLSFPLGVEEGKIIGHGPDGDIKFTFDTLQVTKPFQFVYRTQSQEEFAKYLAPRSAVTDPDKEASAITAVSLRNIIANNNAGTPSYDPEKSPRYRHEGHVAAYVAAAYGVNRAYIEKIMPDNKTAQFMGVSQRIFDDWLIGGSHDHTLRNSPDLTA